MLNSYRTLRTLLCDPAYMRLLLETRSWSTIVDAGFIPEKKMGTDFLDCYLGRDARKLADEPKGVILLMTGCFAPMHDGHIDAMIRAREAVNARLAGSKKVIGGLLSLCHAEYVGTKTSDRAYLSLCRADRMKRVLLRKAPWIHPALWEAFQGGAMNFTSVYRWAQRAFPMHQIVLVFGSDNDAFRLTFMGGELNVCVKRDGEHKKICPEIETNTLYLEGGPYSGVSSTLVRGYNNAKRSSNV